MQPRRKILTRARRPRRATIRLLLVALVCLPLAAVGISAGRDVSTSITAEDAASRQVATIGLVARIDAARSSAHNALLPLVAAAFAGDPQLAASTGLPASVLPLAQSLFPPAAVARQVGAALGQLSSIPLGSAPPAVATAVRQAMDATQRTVGDLTTGSPHLLADAYGMTGMLTALGQAEHGLVVQMLATGTGGPAAGHLLQLETVVTLASRAGDETPAFLGMALGLAPQAAYRTAWLQVWAAYQGAVADANSDLRGDLASSWHQVESAGPYRSYESTVDPGGANGAQQPGLAALVGLATTNEARTELIDGLLRLATTKAIDAADLERAQAHDAVWTAGALAAGLIAGSLAMALLLGRTVSRPLRRLAEEADQISEGRLIEVDPGGPAEVHRVGTALAATVASLTRVEAQAAELAAGRLDSPLLRQPLHGPLGAVVHDSFDRIVVAIREREALQSQLVHQATHDPLTALPNRSAALELVDAALARAARSGKVLGLLFVDLDGFKGINDVYGHGTGDHTLRVAAERMRSCVRGGDVVCRLGGDEFIVVVEDPDSELSIVGTAHRMIEAIRAPFPIGEGELVIGASIGVAVSSDATSSADSLLAEADAAVYRAKSGGRGRVEVFDTHLRSALHLRAEMERAIRLGLARDEFSLYYQPVVDVVTHAVQSYEALVRWHRPGHGIVMPNDFIPVAESSGLIGELGRWVLVEACAQVRRWTDQTPAWDKAPSVAVNVSGRQLSSPQLLDDVRSALDASGIEPAQLTLELTESVLVCDIDSIERLHALKALGVRVALDDFGTGYTSIGQLGRFPVDILKIDRSFIATISSSDKLVQTMIQVAHTFSLDVVAEGVEDDEQLAVLKLLECDSAQGFYFARPQPPAQIDGPSSTDGGIPSRIVADDGITV